jgi:hypothetical protein
VHATEYQLIACHLYKLGVDGIIRICVMENEFSMVLEETHEGMDRGKYAGNITTHKVLRTVL